MKEYSGASKDAANKLVRGIDRMTCKHYSAKEKIRTVLNICERLDHPIGHLGFEPQTSRPSALILQI